MGEHFRTIFDDIDAMNQSIIERNKLLPKEKQEPLILTGLNAEKEVGMQHEFAADLTLQTSHFDSAISLRAGLPPPYDAVRSSKTGLILTKTSNHGFGRGLICANKIFTRIDQFRRNIGFHEKDEVRLNKTNEKLFENPLYDLSKNPELQPIAQLKHSIRDILEMIKEKPKGDLKIVKYDEKTGELIFKYQEGMGPANFMGEFVINIQHARSPQQQRKLSRPWNISELANELGIAKTFGIDLSKMLDLEVPISFREQPSENLKPFMVFSNKKGKPRTSDWDVFSFFHPPTLPSYAKNVYNTFDKTQDTNGKFIQQEGLAQATEQLFNELKKAAEKKAQKELSPIDTMLIQTKRFADLYNKDALERAGCITPFEFLQSRLLNVAYSDEYSPYGAQKSKNEKNPFYDPNIKNLIQHGAENRNPYAPSNLDGKMLHFYKGVIILTTGEDQLIQFYLADDFLKNNLLDVHYGWSMAKWGKILEKQALLKQIDLDNPENNPIAKQKVAKIYKEYKAVQAMELQRKNNAFFVLDNEKADIIMSQLFHYQKVPKGLLKKLSEFYQNEQYLRTHPFVETNYKPFVFKNFHWPIEIWAPVIKKQLELHQKDKDSIPDVPKDLKKCYENYVQLQLVPETSEITPRAIEMIHEQLDFGQRASIAPTLIAKYDAALSRPAKPQEPLIFHGQISETKHHEKLTSELPRKGNTHPPSTEGDHGITP